MYKDSISEIAKKIQINNASIMVTGATGLIGSCIIDTLIAANESGSNNIIYGLSRSESKIRAKFGNKVIPIIKDIIEPLE